MKIRRLLIPPLLFFLLTACENRREEKSAENAPPVGNYAGATAINFSARKFDNKYLSLADLKGKVVLMNFWKKGCNVCITNLDSLQALQNNLKERNFTILAVNGDNLSYVPSSTIKKFVEKKAYTFPVVFDDGFVITEMYKIINIPMTYLIDKEGIITYTKFGKDDWMSGENLERIEKLL